MFLSIGIIILYLVFNKQQNAYLAECALQGIAEEDCSLVKKVYNDFLHAKIWVLLSVVFLFMLSNISRAMRWQMLLRPLGINASLSNAFHSVMLGYFANLGLPRVGEFVRAGTMAKYENAKFDKVMGTVIIDRVADVLSLLVVILMAMFSSYGLIAGFIKSNGDLQSKIYGLITNPYLIGVGILLVVAVIIFFKSNKLKQSALGIKIRSFIEGLVDGLKSIASLEKPWLFVFHSIFIWLMYYLMLYVGFSAFLPTAHLGPIAGLVVFTMGSLGIVIPVPGGMGTYHFLVTAGLQMYGVSGADGFSFANIIFFTIQIFGNIVFGILALVILPIANRE